MTKRLTQVLSTIVLVLVFLPTQAEAQYAPSSGGWEFVSIGLSRDNEGQDRTVVGLGVHASVLGKMLDRPTRIDFGPGIITGFILGEDENSLTTGNAFWGISLPVTVALRDTESGPALHVAISHVLGGSAARREGTRTLVTAGFSILF